jgi:hypothetical protein|tara:strand:+ start:341 stop:2056 length:1716 start_codon:yes stop_codon:yes gene_type:complete
MIEIFLYSLLSSIHLYICGYLFYYVFISKEIAIKNNIFELALYGAFVLCFIALFLNFFTSLNKTVNNVLLFLPIIIFLIFYFNKKLIRNAIFYSIPIAILFLLTVSYDNTYRPDAGSYHLPYISILNENKILTGINNIHYRFGHTSIIQYLSSIYNNNIFNEKGITIPLCLIFCNFIGYFIYEIFNKKNTKLIKIFIFIILVFVLFRVNRYSNFGNDAPANLLFFYLIIESLKENNNFLKIQKTIFASIFIFLNKITLLFGLLIPIYFIKKNFKLNNLFNRVSIFGIIFLILYCGKNILVSGCVIFPIEQSCIKSVYWYDNESKRGSNAINTRLENEAWTKGWPNQIGRKENYKNYLSNFNWVKTWKNSEAKRIIKKLTPFTIFLFLLFIILLGHEYKNKNRLKLINRVKINKDYYFCLIITFLGSLLWFLKFPVFRYGYGYLISLLGILIALCFKNFKFFTDEFILNKSIKYIIIILFLGITIKNGNRIYSSFNENIDPWPNIYSEDKKNKKKINIPITKNQKIIFYKSKHGECYYSKSPCTHFYNGNDFKIDDINLEIFKGYKIYYFER